MPALPTLNLLSLSADSSPGGLSADSGGADRSAFRAVLSERLCVTDANVVDAAVPAIAMPLDLSVQVDGLPDSVLLVMPTNGAGTGQLQLLATDGGELPLLATGGEDFVEVPVLSPTALPLPDSLPTPLAGPLGDATVFSGDDVAPAQTSQGLPAATATASAVPAAASLPAPATLPEVSDTAQPALLLQAAMPLTSAQRSAGESARPGVQGGGVRSILPGAEPAVQGQLPQQADADNQLKPAAAPTLAAGAPVAARDGQDGDFLQQLAAASELSRGPASAIQPADAGLDVSPSAAWANVSATARETAAAAPLTLTLNRPMASPEWNQELGERIVWLADNNRQSAELQLNPRELGPLSVRISVADDVARVTFAAQNAVTREALEAAMPQLKEMLQSQGLSLGEANVSADNAQAREQGDAGERDDSGNEAASADDTGELAPATPQTRHDGLFDGYA